MSTSIRQQILTAIITAFQGASVDTTAGPVPFTTVAFGPLGDEDRRKRFAIGVVPGRDVPTYETSFVFHEMAVDIEFSAMVQSDDPGGQLVSAAMVSESILTVCQTIMLGNVQWGGLAIDTKLIGAETGVRVYATRSFLGVLNTVVHYRHNVLDPTNIRPGIG